MPLKILNTIGEGFDPAAKEILNKIGKVDYIVPKQSELKEKIKDYDMVLCGLGLTFNADVISGTSKLKSITTATTGLDHIDLKVAEKHGVKVISLKGEDEFLNSITGTAELALGLMISLARHIPSSITSVLKGEWDRERFKGHSLHGYTLGVIGLGRLGRWMAGYGESLGMRVVYTDPNVESKNPKWKKVKFDQLLKESDFVSIHVHLSPDTEYMFNKSTFAKMKKTAYLINTSRGKIVNEKDLISVLTKKGLAGYGADVLDGETSFTEKSCEGHPLVKYAKKNSNVMIVPHIGGMTFESRKYTDIFIAEKLQKFL